MDLLDETKRARRGPEPLDPADRRTHCVSVRLSADELGQLDAQREPVKMQRGEYLRTAALHILPPTIPAINAKAWGELARSAANLNQIARRANAEEAVEALEIREILAEFRSALLGVDAENGGESEV